MRGGADNVTAVKVLKIHQRPTMNSRYKLHYNMSGSRNRSSVWVAVKEQTVCGKGLIADSTSLPQVFAAVCSSPELIWNELKALFTEAFTLSVKHEGLIAPPSIVRKQPLTMKPICCFLPDL